MQRLPEKGIILEGVHYFVVKDRGVSTDPENGGLEKPMKTTVAAIDFGTSKIVTLVAENSGSQRCDITAAGVTKYDGYLEEGWNNPNALDEAIRRSIADAEEQSGSKIKEINVGVPGAFTHVYATKVTIPLKGTDPRVTAADVKTAFSKAAEIMLFLNVDSGVYGGHAILVGKERVNVHFLDFGGETQERGEPYDDFRILLLVESTLSAGALDDLIAAQGMDHGVGFAVGEGSQTRRHVFQHLDEDTTQSAEHHMAETLLVFGTDEEFCL